MTPRKRILAVSRGRVYRRKPYTPLNALNQVTSVPSPTATATQDEERDVEQRKDERDRDE
jgi:hypothetical protein